MMTDSEWQNVAATFVTLVGAIAWLRLWDVIAHRGWVEPVLSRKIIHITTGPLFVLCWPLFSTAPYSRFLAAIVPGLITLQFMAVGFGWLSDPAAVQAMTRSGNPREILRGPLLYGLIFVFGTVIFWRTSPIGILALMVVCGGDGLADVIGRRYGTVKLPWSPEKSWVGSAAMFVGAALFSALFFLIFEQLGYFTVFGSLRAVGVLLGIVAIATVVESFPVRDIDNLTLAVTSVVLGLIAFR